MERIGTKSTERLRSASRMGRPIPPLCMADRSEASWMFDGISWAASQGPLGGSFCAPLEPLWASWGPFRGLLEPLEGLLAPLGGFLRRTARIFVYCFLSWAHLGAVLEPSWLGGLGRSWGPLGPCLSVRSSKRRDHPKHCF